MENGIKRIEGKEFLLEINKEIYHKKAIKATCYKFTDRCFIRLNLINDTFNIYFNLKNGKDKDLIVIINEFCNELIDQQLRLDIESSYGNIRELIVRQAFSPIENIEERVRI